MFQIPNNSVLTTKIGLLKSLREYERVRSKIDHGKGQRSNIWLHYNTMWYKIRAEKYINCRKKLGPEDTIFWAVQYIEALQHDSYTSTSELTCTKILTLKSQSRRSCVSTPAPQKTAGLGSLTKTLKWNECDLILFFDTTQDITVIIYPVARLILQNTQVMFYSIVITMVKHMHKYSVYPEETLYTNFVKY